MEHGIKSLLTILTKHLTNLGQMWPKYLSISTFAYNTFNTPNLVNYSPYELVFGRIKYLHEVIQNFKLKRLAVINKDMMLFQYSSGDLVYIIQVNYEWHLEK